MITVNLIPQRTLGAKLIEWNAPILKLDGVSHDLSLLPDGATAAQTADDGQIIYAERNGTDYIVQVLAVGEQWTTMPSDPPIEMAANGIVYELPVIPDPVEDLV